MVIPPFPLFNFFSIKILKEYLYTVKIILNSDGTFLFQKRDYDLNNTLYFEGTDIIEGTMFLKTILNSEGTLNRKGTMVLRTLLISKGQKKGDEEKKDSSTQVKK